MINKGPSYISRFFPNILLLAGQGISFVVPRTLLYRGLLNQGSTALTFFCPTIILLLSKIQLVVYYQCFFLSG